MTTKPPYFPAHSRFSQQARVILEKENLLCEENAYGFDVVHGFQRLLAFFDVAERFWRELVQTCPERVDELVEHHPAFLASSGFLDLSVLVSAHQAAPESEGKTLLTAYLLAVPTLDLSSPDFSEMAREAHGWLLHLAFGPCLRPLVADWQASMTVGLDQARLDRTIPTANENPGHLAASRQRL